MKTYSVLLGIFVLSEVDGVVAAVDRDAEAMCLIVLEEAIICVAVDINDSRQSLSHSFVEFTLIEISMELHLAKFIMWYRLGPIGNQFSPTNVVTNNSPMFD